MLFKPADRFVREQGVQKISSFECILYGQSTKASFGRTDLRSWKLVPSRAWAARDWQRQRDLLLLLLLLSSLKQSLHCPSNEFCMHRRAASGLGFALPSSSSSSSSPVSKFYAQISKERKGARAR